ncbi:MAG: heme-binding protein [Pseudomonadota bacterium]
MRTILFGGLAALSLLLGAPGARAADGDDAGADAPTPDYRVVLRDEAFEIREYDSLLLAEVTVRAKTRSGASGTAFRALASYIFGDAEGGETIGMTAPVFVETVDRTDAPVLVASSRGETDLWVMGFIMPERYDRATLPKPVDERIVIRELPARRVAAVRFSGSWRDAWMEKKRAELRAWVAEQGETPTADPVYAFYNDPFTLPWNRRNEVIVELAPAERP